jgi:3-hydroxyacyl-[acyl-carrier-protein] dehydratase
VSDPPLKLPLEIEDIKAILPHRTPFLLVDRVLELEEDRRVVAIKNVTSNERYFIAGPGGVPTMPASILTEAMAQAGAVLILSKPENRSRLVYFMGIDRVRYRRPVVAGDQVILECEVLRLRSKMGSLAARSCARAGEGGRARVDGRVVCEGQMTFALGDRPDGA